MKTFRDFILEAEYRAPVNSRQAFNMDSTTQKNLNSARPMGPGKNPKGQLTFKLQPTNIPMK
jgi:hypothetical protein